MVLDKYRMMLANKKEGNKSKKLSQTHKESQI